MKFDGIYEIFMKFDGFHEISGSQIWRSHEI